MSIGGRLAKRPSAALRASTPDLVVCDIRLPDIRGDELFRRLATNTTVPPFLFVTAYGDIDQAVSIMRAGGGDYVTKPFAMPPFIMRACSLIQRHPISKPEVTLGVSQGMQELQTVIERISSLTSPVLITGETGAGKEYVRATCTECRRVRRNRLLRSIAPRFLQM